MLGWLAEFVLLCFGKVVVDNGIWIDLVYSTVRKNRLEISSLCNGTQGTTRAKTSRHILIFYDIMFYSVAHKIFT